MKTLKILLLGPTVFLISSSLLAQDDFEPRESAATTSTSSVSSGVTLLANQTCKCPVAVENDPCEQCKDQGECDATTCEYIDSEGEFTVAQCSWEDQDCVSPEHCIKQAKKKNWTIIGPCEAYDLDEGESCAVKRCKVVKVDPRTKEIEDSESFPCE